MGRTMAPPGVWPWSYPHPRHGRRLQSVRRLAAAGVTLAVLDEGDGAAVLLLHGFPDSSRLWRRQVRVLVEAGLRVVAPDLRGFGDSDRPDGVDAYRVRHSVADMLAILDDLEIERAHVVGHDWGAGVAWALAAFVPDRVDRLVAMSVGHPNALREPSLEQREKGWYQLLFQFPAAEDLVRRDDWKLFREVLRGDGDADRYISDLARPGALTAALNWYRANAAPAQELERTRPFPAVAAPTMGLWSSGDNYLTEESMLDSAGHVTGAWRYERVEGASHWLQLDAPDRVNDLLLEFLAPPAAAS
jgi:pimeloyl-ACP methyl ester carboxylesterase